MVLKAELIEVLQAEQADLWFDLNSDIRLALNGYWSVGIENTIKRIIRNMQVVGFTHPDNVPIPILTSGVYLAVIKRANFKLPEFNLDQCTIALYPPRWPRTVAKIKEMDLNG